MQSQPPAIELAGLTKQFGRHRAIDSLNLAVHPGSVFGFLGPNGAGKTTTIRMLLGLIRPTQGGGRILGYDIERERAAILPHVGAIVESPAFYPILSGRDNLRVFARTAGNEDARNIARMLEKAGLSERAKDKVKTYSLGTMNRYYQRQQSHLFTVRVWQEELGEGQSEWRGKVQHVRSGEGLYFCQWSALVASLEKRLTEFAARPQRDQSSIDEITR